MVGKLNFEVCGCGVEDDADVIAHGIACALDRTLELAFTELAHPPGHLFGSRLERQAEG